MSTLEVEEPPGPAATGTDDAAASLRRAATAAFGWCRAHPVVLVLVAVVVANLPYLTGVVDPNPLLYTSTLTPTKVDRLLPGTNYIDPNVGITAQAFGHLAASDWLHLHIPWWNPYEGIGAPLAGEMQSAALFLPLILFDSLGNGQILFRLVLEMAAGVSTYYLLARFVHTRLIAVAGGVYFALNGTYSWMFHAPANPIAFAPLLLLGIEQCLDGDTRWLRGWPLVGLAVALSLYAGFPEVAYIDGVLCALWLAARSVEIDRARLLPAAKRIAGGVGVGLLLAAPVLLSFVAYLPHANIGAHNGAFGRVTVPGSFLLPSLVMPYALGPIFGWYKYDPTGSFTYYWQNIGGYLGFAVVFLALVGLLGRRHRVLRLVLGFWVLVGVSRTAGFRPALDIINAVPVMANTAFYRYADPSWSLAMVALAALGMDDLYRKRQPAKLAAAWLVTAAVAALATHYALDLLGRLQGAPHNRLWGAASVAFAAGVIVICGVGSLLSPRRWRVAAVAVALAGESLAFFVVPQFSALRPTKVDLAPVAWLQAHLGNDRFYTLGPISPDYGSYFGIAEAAVNDVPTPKAYSNYIATKLDTNVDPLTFTGTVMTNQAGPTPAEEFVAHLANYEAIGVKYVIMLRATALPRLPAGVSLPVVYRDRSVQILQLPHPSPLFGVGGGCATAGPGSIDTVEVTCSRSGTLVYRELYLPGDAATDNGNHLGVQERDGLFQSVELHPGVNSLRFSYAPPHASLAWLALLVGVLALAGKVAADARRRRL